MKRNTFISQPTSRIELSFAKRLGVRHVNAALFSRHASAAERAGHAIHGPLMFPEDAPGANTHLAKRRCCRTALQGCRCRGIGIIRFVMQPRSARLPLVRWAATLTINLCFIANAAGADDLLNQWVEAAFDQNQEVISARKAWEAAQQKARQTRSFDDPMVGVDWMRMDSTRFDDYDQTEYMISQRLPWFGKRRARTDAAGLRAEAEGFRYLETVRQVRARVRSAYWDLWAAHRALEINRKNRDLLEQLEAVARARYEAGQGLQADVLKAQVELARLENDLETFRSDFEVAQAAVNRLLSEPPDTPRLPPDVVETPPLRWTLDEALYSARLYCCTLISYLLDLQARSGGARGASPIRSGYRIPCHGAPIARP